MRDLPAGLQGQGGAAGRQHHGVGAMGNGLPSSIGAYLAGGGRRTGLGNGDGGLQLNIQELETIARLRLPIKLFVLDNDGYASIRTSQGRYFKRLSGADRTSGYSVPDIRRVAEALSLPGGQEAASLEVAKKYLDEFGKLAKENNTMILPGNLTDVAGMVATAMSAIKQSGSRQPLSKAPAA